MVGMGASARRNRALTSATSTSALRINGWNNALYNALRAFNSGELFRQLGTFCVLVAFRHCNVCVRPLRQPDAADTLAAMADA